MVLASGPAYIYYFSAFAYFDFVVIVLEEFESVEIGESVFVRVHEQFVIHGCDFDLFPQ
jgi:hypothetical protein